MPTKKIDMRTSRKSGPVTAPSLETSRPTRSAKKLLPTDEVSSEHIMRKSSVQATIRTPKSNNYNHKKPKPKNNGTINRNSIQLHEQQPQTHDDSAVRPRRSNTTNYIAKKFLEDNDEVPAKRTKPRRGSGSAARGKYAFLPPLARLDNDRYGGSKRGRRPKYLSSLAADSYGSYYGSIGWEERDVNIYDSDPRYLPTENYSVFDHSYPPEDPQHSGFVENETNFQRSARRSFLPRREYSHIESIMDDVAQTSNMSEEEMPYFDRSSAGRFRENLNQEEMFMDPTNQNNFPTHRRKSPVRPIRNPPYPPDHENPIKAEYEVAAALAQVGESLQQRQLQDVHSNQMGMMEVPAEEYSHEDYESYDRTYEDDINYHDIRGSISSQNYESGPTRRAPRRYPVGKTVGLPRKGPPTILKRIGNQIQDKNGNAPSSNVVIRPPPFTVNENKVVINTTPTPKLINVSHQGQNQPISRTVLLTNPAVQHQTPKITASTQIVAGQPVVKLLSASNRPVQNQSVIVKGEESPHLKNEEPTCEEIIAQSQPIFEATSTQPPVSQSPIFIATTNANGTRTLIPASMLTRPSQPIAQPSEPTASELLFGKRPSQIPQPTTQIIYTQVPVESSPKMAVTSPYGVNLLANSVMKLPKQQPPVVMIMPSQVNGNSNAGPNGTSTPRVLSVSSINTHQTANISHLPQ